LNIRVHGHDRVFVILGTTEFKQVGGVLQALADVVEAADGAVEGLLFTPQVLRTLGVIPERGVFKGSAYFRQASEFGIEVKDTSASLRCGPSGPQAWLRGR
jgi:hypothetical protein